MSRPIKYIQLSNKDWLYSEYIIKNKSTLMISKEQNCSRKNVNDWLKKHNIPRRPPNLPKPIDYNFLYDKYIIEKLNSREIALLLNMDRTSIVQYLHRYNIKIRSLSEAISLRNKSPKYQEISRPKQAASAKIAWDSNRTRKNEYSKKFSGKNNPMYGKCRELSPVWKGGLSFEPYCPKFNKNIKEKIRNEFGRQCVLCGKDENFNRKKLDIHHINYQKDQGCNGKEWKLIPLCRSCHAKTNHDRLYYEYIFQNICELCD